MNFKATLTSGTNRVKQLSPWQILLLQLAVVGFVVIVLGGALLYLSTNDTRASKHAADDLIEATASEDYERAIELSNTAEVDDLEPGKRSEYMHALAVAFYELEYYTDAADVYWQLDQTQDLAFEEAERAAEAADAAGVNSEAQHFYEVAVRAADNSEDINEERAAAARDRLEELRDEATQ